MDSLLQRFVLNDSRRVSRCAKLGLDMELFGIQNILTDIQSNIPYTSYPVPSTVLHTVFPQYVDLWSSTPESLNTEEENYSREKYRDLVSNQIIFSYLPKKKENKKYYSDMMNDLAELHEELSLYSENEKEFDTKNMGDFLEEDMETLKNQLETPFPKFTRQLAGGILAGRIYVFEAGPKSKKSMLMLYMSMWWARQGKNIMYISTELMDLEARERIFSIIRGTLDPTVIQEIEWSKADKILVEKVTNELKSYPGKFQYKFFPSPNMRKIEKYLENQDYDLLIIDHPSEGRITPNYRTKDEKSWESEARVYSDIFTFARKVRKPILLPAFINRSGMENIKKFGGVEKYQSAGAFSKNALVDCVMNVIPAAATTDSFGRVKQLITLQPKFIRRSGKEGLMEEPIQLEFNGTTCLFHEVVTMGDAPKVAQESWNAAIYNQERKAQ